MQANYRPPSEGRAILCSENVYNADPSKLRMRNYHKDLNVFPNHFMVTEHILKFII